MLIAWRRTGVLLTSLAAVVCLTACGGAQSRFDSHFKKGKAYYAQGDFVKASVEFRNALQIEPQNDAARLAAGEAAEKLHKPRDAYGLYQAVVDASPTNAAARVDLARLMVYSGSADQAVKVIEPGLAKYPNNAQLLALRAAARMELKNREGATADADRALQLAPSDESAIEVRAGLYKSSGDVASAKALVEGAAAKAPSSMPEPPISWPRSGPNAARRSSRSAAI